MEESNRGSTRTSTNRGIGRRSDVEQRLLAASLLILSSFIG
jgi:hypothetical protein